MAATAGAGSERSPFGACCPSETEAVDVHRASRSGRPHSPSPLDLIYIEKMMQLINETLAFKEKNFVLLSGNK